MKKPQPDPIVNMNVRIPRDVRTAAKVAAAKRGITLNQFVTQALVKAAALAAAVALVACSGNVDTSTQGTKCYLKFQGQLDPVACEGAGFEWVDAAGIVHDCGDPCPVGASCSAGQAVGVCR